MVFCETLNTECNEVIVIGLLHILNEDLFMEKDNICDTDIGIYHIMYLCNHRTKDGHKLYHVKCNICGFETDMMKSGVSRTKKCSHIKVDGTYINYKQKIGSSEVRNKIYNTYRKIVFRCYDSSDKDYKYYGGKGIRVCKEWLENQDIFLCWALKNGYKKGLTIDRIDSNKDYCPENCRWITLEENARRAGKVNWITVNEMTMTGRQWAIYLGKSIQFINKMVKAQGLEYTTKYISELLNDKTGD